MNAVDLAMIGVWLLVFSAAVIILEMALAGIWTARLARRARRLSVQLASEQRAVQADLEKLRAAMAETAELWQPYARIFRYLRHPFVGALIESYSRHRA